MFKDKRALSAIGAVLLTFSTCVFADSTTVFCYHKEGLVPKGTPPTEFRFDEVGTFEYGTKRQKMKGSLTERDVMFLIASESSGWIIDRMTGDWFFFGPIPGYSEPRKTLIGLCKKAADREF